jgi:hypothetical protein
MSWKDQVKFDKLYAYRPNLYNYDKYYNDAHQDDDYSWAPDFKLIQETMHDTAY